MPLRFSLPLLAATTLIAIGCVGSSSSTGSTTPRPEAAVSVTRGAVQKSVRDLPRLVADGRPPPSSLFVRAEEDADPETLAPPPIKAHPVPAGVTCAVTGGGSPFPESCEPPSSLAFASRDGGAPIARFTYENVEVTWGFFEKAGRAFAAVDSGNIRMRGYVDPSTIRFQLAREVEVLAGHVWLAADAPVHVARAVVGGGVQVRVDGDVRGVADIFSVVECRDVRFDLVLTPSAPPSTRTPNPEPVRFAAPRGKALGLFTGPSGRPITVLHDDESSPLPPLSVLAEERGFARVAFDTTYASFDAWVPSEQILEGGNGRGIGGMGACGGSRDTIGTRLPRVTETTAIRVGASPVGEPVESLTIEADSAVVVDEERNGFVAVSVFSEIQPPDGKKFWIPAAVVER